MTSANARAISSFLAGGGQIVRVPETVLVPMQIVLDYLQSCGIAATFSKSDPNVYWLDRKRVSLSQAVIVANRQRRMQKLPPFAVQL